MLKNDYATIKKQALLDVKRYFGTMEAVAKAISISPQRLNYWFNNETSKIPYHYAITLEVLTQVSVERLAPERKLANIALRKLLWQKQNNVKTIAIDNIIITSKNEDIILDYSVEKLNPKWLERPILIENDNILISGIEQIMLARHQGLETITAIIVDLTALHLNVRTIDQLLSNSWISEQVAIAQALEQLFEIERITKYQQEFNFNEDRVQCDHSLSKRIMEEKVALLSGFECRFDYVIAKRVVESRKDALIMAMNTRKVSITEAYSLLTESGKPTKRQWISRGRLMQLLSMKF